MHCKRIRPVWEELTQEYGDQVTMVMVDRDSREGRSFAESHGIYYQPGFVVIDSAGEVTYASLGPYEAEDVEALVRDAAAQ